MVARHRASYGTPNLSITNQQKIFSLTTSTIHLIRLSRAPVNACQNQTCLELQNSQNQPSCSQRRTTRTSPNSNPPIHKQIQPASAIAHTLFNQLVLAAWNMERTQRLEASLRLQSDPLLDQAQSPVLARITTCRLRAERTFHKYL